MRNWRIRTQLLALVLATALPFLIFALLSIRNDADSARERASARTLALAQQIGARVDEHIVNSDALLGAIGATLAADLNAVAANDRTLRAIQAGLPAYYGKLLVLAPDGSMLNLTAPLPSASQALNFADRDYFQRAVSRRSLAISAPLRSRVSGDWIVILARPILGAGGEVRAVVALPIVLARFQNMLVPEGLPSSSLVTLLDERGVVLARSEDPATWAGRDISAVPSVAAALQRREGTAEFVSADGVTRLSGFVTTRQAAWMVYVGIPTSIALTDVRGRNRDQIVLAMVAILIAASLALLLAQRISAPVARLREGVARLASSASREPVEATGHGEIGTLAADFNRMADALQQQQSALLESERRYRDLLDNVELVVVVLDRDGRLTQCNDYLLKVLGWTRDELLGKDWFALSIPAEAGDVKSVFRRMLADEELVRHYENEILTRNGERRLIHWNNSILRSPDGAIIGTASIGEDITERKRAEDKVASQIAELQRWYQVTLGREDRVRQLKAEVNALQLRLGEAPRYQGSPNEPGDET